MKKLTKEQMVKKILNNSEIENVDNYQELLDMLVDKPISINVEQEEKRTVGEN